MMQIPENSGVVGRSRSATPAAYHVWRLPPRARIRTPHWPRDGPNSQSYPGVAIVGPVPVLSGLVLFCSWQQGRDVTPRKSRKTKAGCVIVMAVTSENAAEQEE